jgi:hypothetical protein
VAKTVQNDKQSDTKLWFNDVRLKTDDGDLNVPFV